MSISKEYRVKTISIAVPVYEEESNLKKLFGEIENLEKIIKKDKFKLEIIIGDNFSKDKSWKMIKSWSVKKKNRKALRYSKNIGFQSSIIQMMKIANGDAFVVLQSDLQDPPLLIRNFISEWRKGSKVVVGVIKNRKEGLIDNMGRKIFYYFMHLTSDGRNIRNVQDYYLLDKEIYSEIAQSSHSFSYIRGQIFSYDSKCSFLTYDRNKRIKGKSKFRFPQKYNLALDALTIFGVGLWRKISIFSLGLGVFSIVLALGLFTTFLFGIRFAQQGWLSLITLQLIIFTFITGMFAIFLEFLSRIYRTMIPNNSHYVIDNVNIN
jgi:glycosyltransferase involved in cell wall biosynthesis